MKIIKAGKIPEKIKQIKRFECLQCGCIFEADEGEYICGEYYGYPVQCPYCREMAARVVVMRKR